MGRYSGAVLGSRARLGFSGADASTPEKKSSKKDKKGDKGHKMKGAKTPKSSSKKSKHKA